MKSICFLILFFSLVFNSCTAIYVNTDYDKHVDFSTYKTYAYDKTGIDKVEISDLDKRRILSAIDQQLLIKGFTKSSTPDIIITFFTKSNEQVNVSHVNFGWGYGWGWSPFVMGGTETMVTSTTEGTLYIDFIDAKRKEIFWHGEGTGVLSKDPIKKDQRINEFVLKILMQYPPKIK